jgi:hypothetical protein
VKNIFRRGHDEEHQDVQETLDRHEQDLHEMAKRVRNLEIEAGMYPRTKLREANGGT